MLREESKSSTHYPVSTCNWVGSNWRRELLCKVCRKAWDQTTTDMHNLGMAFWWVHNSAPRKIQYNVYEMHAKRIMFMTSACVIKMIARDFGVLRNYTRVHFHTVFVVLTYRKIKSTKYLSNVSCVVCTDLKIDCMHLETSADSVRI